MIGMRLELGKALAPATQLKDVGHRDNVVLSNSLFPTAFLLRMNCLRIKKDNQPQTRY